MNKKLWRFILNVTPDSVRIFFRKLLAKKHELWLQKYPIYYQSSAVNIYHCCVHKTASQWIKTIFSDPIVYQYSGLLPCDVRLYLGRTDPRNINARYYDKPFPEKRIILTLIHSFDCFQKLPKPTHHKAFYVIRDPRDIVVSYYFSAKYSHTPMGNIKKIRNRLHQLSLKEGLLFVIDHLNTFGLFQSLRSWIEAKDINYPIIRYEDLTGENKLMSFINLFHYCDIQIPQSEVEKLLNRYSFQKLKGKKEEDVTSHYRKGRPGDWENYFDPEITKKFYEVTQDLTKLLGYS